MVDYVTYCKVLYLNEQGLKTPQIAKSLCIDKRTVRKWLREKRYRQRINAAREGVLDPYKAQIIEWLEKYPYSGVQLLQRLREIGYTGGITTLRMYIAKVRPRKEKAFLTLSFEPGECAQVDWGQFGTVPVGSTLRRLSFFVMVLCYSRKMYLEFTVSETMEHFLNCHKNAFEYFGAVPKAIMVDNLKSAVLRHALGEKPVFNQRYLDCSQHYGFTIRACNVRKGNEKGRVENAVGYIKKNFLAGQDFKDFSSVNPEAKVWLENIANKRIHGTTQKVPNDLFIAEKPHMHPLLAMPYDTSATRSVRATNRFRVAFDGNAYSVPSCYASLQLSLKAFTDRICIYHENNLIAKHNRSYDRNVDIEDPDHPKELLQERRNAREQRLHTDFLKISSKADLYYQELTKRRMNARQHIRKIIALGEIYGEEKVSRAIDDAITYQAFSCEYIANILEQRERSVAPTGALHLTRRQDLLKLDIAEPNLSIYGSNNDQNDEGATSEHK